MSRNAERNQREVEQKWKGSNGEVQNPDHYSGSWDVADFIERHSLGFLGGNIIKYVVRHKKKDGLKDLKKAKHYLEKLIDNYPKV